MKPYSQDLRERVVQDVNSGACSQTAAAVKYSVSLSFVQKLMKRVRDTGSAAAKPATGGVKRRLAAAEKVIRAEVKRHPDVTLNALCEHVEAELELWSEDSMMSRELQRLGITLKKRSSTPANGRRHG
ncbi:MAG: transposase [Nitrososphaera sp.]|nr:transposase [Nitrososphaera sp.]